MIRTALLLLFLASPLLGAPPSLEIPAEVRPQGQYVRLLPKTDAEGVSYVGLSGLDPFPSDELADSRKFILDTRGLTVGRYKFAAIAWSGKDHTRFDFEVVIGDAPVVVIPPGPPVVPPAPVSGKRQVLIIRESTSDDAAFSRLLVGVRNGAPAAYLTSKGHRLYLLDDDDRDMNGKASPLVEAWRPHFMGMKLPAIFILDDKGLLVHKQECPTTPEAVIDLVKAKGG